MFCPKCGVNLVEGATFCPNCGTPVAQQQAPVQQVPVQPVVNPYGQPVVYVKPKTPGRGLGIAGMVLGIIGLVYGFGFFISSLVGMMAINENEIPSYAYAQAESILTTGLIIGVLLYSSMSIMAVCFGTAARKRGYVCGVSMSGIVMGVIGIILYALGLCLGLSVM